MGARAAAAPVPAETQSVPGAVVMEKLTTGGPKCTVADIHAGSVAETAGYK